jgi:3-phytase
VINPFAVVRALASMFEPNRTMLGKPQLEQLKHDLLAAHNAGITWKFVMVPEPIQHMGWFGGVDRWEGYALERTEVLKFIEDNAIRNVVFIAADVHTMFINNLTYQTEPSGEHFPTHCFEISTECAAYSAPTGQLIIENAAAIGALSQSRYDAYLQMTLAEKDALLEDLFNRIVLRLQGFTPLGLEDSPIDYERITGGWVVGHSFGWTEFEVALDTERLTITTYGVPAYTPAQASSQPEQILSLVPEILSQLIITPLATTQ